MVLSLRSFSDTVAHIFVAFAVSSDLFTALLE